MDTKMLFPLSLPLTWLNHTIETFKVKCKVMFLNNVDNSDLAGGADWGNIAYDYKI